MKKIDFKKLLIKALLYLLGLGVCSFLVALVLGAMNYHMDSLIAQNWGEAFSISTLLQHPELVGYGAFFCAAGLLLFLGLGKK